MARHRNVRSMNYNDEYDGYDDVYGHSVEDDYCISPSDEAQFLYDRTRQPQISAFFNDQDNITEENENDVQSIIKNDSEGYVKPTLSDLDEAKLLSCLEEIRNVIGDSIAERILVKTVLKCEFDVNKSLDSILSSTTQSSIPVSDVSKPQRVRKDKDKGGKRGAGGGAGAEAEAEAPRPPAVKVVPPGAKTLSVTKGFEVVVDEKGDFLAEARARGALGTPRSLSPASGRASPGDADGSSSSSAAAAAAAAAARAAAAKTPSRSHSHKADILAQYEQERGQSKRHLHMVVIGHVDAGKSTLMGHLLLALGQVSKKTMHKYEQESKKLGKQSFVYAWILDETGEERSRGITMDVGQSKFETQRKVVTLLDAPGHKDFIPNMITGATQADVALLVADATRGEFETGFESGGQTREHALLVRSLGVSQLGVVVNKLDTVDWSQERFQEVVDKLGMFLRQAGFRESDVTFVPCSGLTGVNLVEPPKEEKLLEWYKGPTLLNVIDNFRSPERPISKPFRLSINDIYKGTGSGFCISGRVETGFIEVGDKVLVQPQNEVALTKALTVDDVVTPIAYAGDQVSITIAGIEMQNMSVGYILCDLAQPIPVTSRFEARIVVFNIKVPITKGYSVILHHQSLSEQAVVTKLVAQLHKSSGEVVKRRPRCLLKNWNAVVELETSRPICLELYKDVKELGRFMLRIGGVTIAAGLVTQIF